MPEAYRNERLSAVHPSSCLGRDHYAPDGMPEIPAGPGHKRTENIRFAGRCLAVSL
jgi:hypothetical protein